MFQEISECFTEVFHDFRGFKDVSECFKGIKRLSGTFQDIPRVRAVPGLFQGVSEGFQMFSEIYEELYKCSRGFQRFHDFAGGFGCNPKPPEAT